MSHADIVQNLLTRIKDEEDDIDYIVAYIQDGKVEFVRGAMSFETGAFLALCMSHSIIAGVIEEDVSKAASCSESCDECTCEEDAAAEPEVPGDGVGSLVDDTHDGVRF